MRIIHLSDFHLEKEDLTYHKKNIIDALLLDLQERIDNDTIIAFTGDLIDKGGYNFKDKEMAFLHFEDYFITPILQKFKLSKDRFLMVPGNHDVQRNSDDKYTEMGLSQTLISRDVINEFTEKNQEKGGQIAKMKAFKEFEQLFYNGILSKKLSYFDSSFIIKIQGQSIGVSCLNSSWRCFDENDKGKLIIGENHVLSSIEYIKNCDIKIALVHHSFDWLLESDSKIVRPIIEREFDIILSGHVHSVAGHFESGFWGNIFNSVASSTIADYSNDREYTNGYCIIDFDKNESVKGEYRKYDEKNDKFILNTEAGNSEGYFLLNFPTKKQVEIRRKQDTAIENILNVNIPSLDEHLIIYGSDTKASCKLNDVFVEPRISNVPNSRVTEKKISYYTIDDIIKNSSNFLIYGAKESGKTILIDKILIEITNGYNELKQIPVLINFSEVGNKDFETIISRFLSIGIQDIKDFLLTEKIVLLIDNLSFDSKKHHYKLNKLNNLVRLYPNVKVIATSEQILESTIPTEYLEFNSEFNFELGFIQHLRSKEIKILIQNWFKGRDVDFKENIQQLINSFTKLALPRTPLSITLFLWIIERQEKRPINNSTLVEIFVENLLEKANFEHIFSQTFDYRNKERLLAHLAHFMLIYGNGDENYKVTYPELESYLTTYLDKRIEVSPKDVISDFVKRGILIEFDEGFVRFKASFLFHFFIAKYMEYNEEFKNYVIDDSRYLEFTNEIEYFTGLKRDDITILEFTQRKLDEAFSDINEQMKNHNIDSFFETKDKASSQISFERVKSKPTEEEFEAMYDDQLSDLPVNTPIPKKDINVSSITKSEHLSVDRILKLAAIVLKNSEEIDDISLRESSYKNLLKNSISFLVFYKASLLSYYDSNKETPKSLPQNIDFKLFLRLLPLMHQVLLYDWMGSLKMSGIIKDKIQQDRANPDVSELEKFLSVFIYSDIKATNYPQEIKKYLKGIKSNYIKDTCFFKLITYYFLRSKDKSTDMFYLELLSDVKGRQRKNKDELMKKLMKEKQFKLFKGIDED